MNPLDHKTNHADLIKYDTPHTVAKISRMLEQLEFKYQIEKKYQSASLAMLQKYEADGDRKSKSDARAKRMEAEQRLVILKQALNRYKALHVAGDVDDEEEEEDEKGERKGNLRRPLTGKLQVRVVCAKDLDHAPTKTFRNYSETSVEVKVENDAQATTKLTRNDRWGEDFEIHVDKANEIEISIKDKSGDFSIPIGILWIRISDIVEELRRKKTAAGMDGGAGWVTANNVGDGASQPSPQNPYGASGGQFGARPYSGYPGPDGGPPGPGAAGAYGRPPPAQTNTTAATDGIEAWFAVEPAGRVYLKLNFVKENARKRPLQEGLGRQGAVRKRKEEVHEMNGHRFVQQQFYQIMRCALCGDFLPTTGYQCEDCKYCCHKKCYPRVVTKCISKSNSETDPDEAKLNHRIHHRFEPLTNIGTNWCCHCGYMLPLGKKNSRKCSECGITCHLNCAHLVPDFCGMSMEMANQILTEIKKKRLIQQGAASRPPVGRPPPPSAPGTIGQEGARTSFHEDMYGQQPYAPSSPSQQQQRPPFPSEQYPPGAPGQQYGSQMRPPPAHEQYSYQNQPAPYMPGRPGQPGQPSSPKLQAGRLPQQQQQQQIPQPMVQPGYRPGPPPQQQPMYPDPKATIGRPPPQQQMPPYAQVPPHQQGMPPQQQVIARPQPGPLTRRVGLEDFNFLAVLGKGNFGKVMLAEERTSGELYAIKVLKKEYIIENDEVESTKSEKRVFLAANKERHPFLIGLHSCFQTETRIYFVMEYVSGGDLMLHIQREQFNPRRAQFYACEVLMALEYFHKNGIIYRDLKLDNILLALDGHIKVADYGLCKENMWFQSTTSTFCGTPEFMAPEILLEQRYGRAVDWWAFGVLVYEMLLGTSPFRGDDEDEIFDAILEDEPLYPIHMARDQVSILQKLLTRDPERRLGSGEEDAEEIKRHPFFRGINWDDMFNKRVPPPFYPKIDSATDTSNFDPEFTSERPVLTPVNTALTASMQEEFRGFSYVADWAAAGQPQPKA